MPTIDDFHPSEPQDSSDTAPSAPEVPTEPAAPAPPEPAANAEPGDEDPATDTAVDDIMKQDSDTTLAAQDAAAEQAVIMHETKWQLCKDKWAAWWGDPRKRWGTILAIIIVLLALFAVPFTRYSLLGLFIREKVTVMAFDSKSGEPVSGAAVQLGAAKAETDASGKAVLYPHVGSTHLQVSKTYYQATNQAVLVTLSAQHNTFKATLVAQGVQVKLKVVDTISGQPVANAQVSAGGTKAQTGQDGQATLVVASGTGTQAASVSLSGYNTANVTLHAGGDLSKNTFKLTPAGTVYYVDTSNNIVGMHADGTGKQVIYRNGTNATTILSVSPDNRYLAYFVSGSNPNVIDLVDTTDTTKVVTVDSVTGDGSFLFDGWSGDTLVYTVTTPDAEQLKSWDASSGHPLLLDKLTESSTEARSFSDVYVLGSQVVYAKSWTMDTTGDTTKRDELDAIQASGSGHAVLQTFNVAYNQGQPHLMTAQNAPGVIYIYDGSSYYSYANGKVTPVTITASDFSSAANTAFVPSPSGNKVLWKSPQKLLIVSNADGSAPKQLSVSASYQPYGWIGEQDVLVQDGGSIYAVPAAGGNPYRVPTP